MADNKTFSDFLPESFKAEFKKLQKQFFDTVTPPAPVAPTVPAAPAPTVTNQSTLPDGTVVKWDTPTLTIGSVVTVVNPDGSGELPIPDGEYVLADGTNLTTVGGKATEVESAAAEVTEPEMAAAPAADPMAALEARLKACEDKLAAMAMASVPTPVTQSAEFKEVKDIADSAKENTKQLFELVGKMLDVPSATPINTPEKIIKDSKQSIALDKFITRKTIK